MANDERRLATHSITGIVRRLITCVVEKYSIDNSGTLQATMDFVSSKPVDTKQTYSEKATGELVRIKLPATLDTIRQLCEVKHKLSCFMGPW